jgi:hypothetical protein
MKKLIEYLERQPRAALLTAAVLLVFAIGLIDYVTGPGLSVSIFYLLSIALACWFNENDLQPRG